jgi:hypothetical protein
MNRSFVAICAFLFVLSAACQSAGREATRFDTAQARIEKRRTASPQPAKRNSARLIHTLVALCDNESQGIVPVPPRIGNGDDPANNLYWGARFGVKTFFKTSSDWQPLAEERNPKPAILERIILKHRTRDVYLIADAYRGREIKQCVTDFFLFSSGRDDETIRVNSAELYAGGGADLIAYVGHDGLMDFSLDSYPQKSDERARDAVILACASKSYFAKPLAGTGANPLLWTTGLMAPEAYVLKAAIDGWVLKENGEKIRRRAAGAYHQYQRCGLNAALKLFSSGL